MKITNLSVYRPVLMTMFILSFVVMGAFSFTDLAVELFPKVEFPVVSVQTLYIGAGPGEVENLITRHIEEEVSAISGIKNIRSSSLEGVSIVIVEFELGTSVDVAAADVKDKIEIVKSKLPLDAEAPIVLKFDFGAQAIVNIAVSSERPLEELFEITEDFIKPELLKIDGLASVTIVGGKEREIQIDFDPQSMRSQNITITDIIVGLASQNMNIPSGHITEAMKEYSIRVSGEFDDIEDIKNIIFTIEGGASVRLRDIASVNDTFKEQRKTARFNDEAAVGVSLIKSSDANVVQVADEAIAAIAKLKTMIPEDVNIYLASDNSTFIRNSIAEVMNNMGIGIILTAIILFLFLHSWQGTIIAAIAMPTSIIATFILMKFAGFTINFMTLLGLAVTVGVLVTNSIVVLENIIRHTNNEDDVKEASTKGTSEIATAVGASTLTNVVVFTPMAFMGGIVGQFFFQFGLTVAFATIFSYLVSITLTPMMSSMLLSKKKSEINGFYIFALAVFLMIVTGVLITIGTTIGGMFAEQFGAASTYAGIVLGIGFTLYVAKKTFGIAVDSVINNIIYKVWAILLKVAIVLLVGTLVYELFAFLFDTTIAVGAIVILAALVIMQKTFGLLDKFAAMWDRFYDGLALDYKNSLAWALKHKIMILTVTFGMFFVSLYLAQFVGTEFMAQSDQGYITVGIELPAGSNFDQTNKALYKVEKVLNNHPYIESYYTVLGEAPGTFMGNNTGVQFGQIQVKLKPKAERDFKSTSSIIEEFKPQLIHIPSISVNLSQADAGGGGGSPMQIDISGDDLEKLKEISEEVMAIAKATPGAVELRSSLQDGVPEFRIIPDREKLADYGISIFTLASTLRNTIEGNIATKYRVGNKEYDVRVQMNDEEVDYADKIQNISIKKKGMYIPLTELATIEFAEGPTSIARKNKSRLVMITGNYSNRSGGDIVAEIESHTSQMDLPDGYSVYFSGEAETQAESFAELIKTLLLAIILSYMVLAAIMESYFHPLIVMMTLPLAVIGVIISLLVTGKTLNLISLMAMVMLVGIVVNNAILMVDYIQVLRKEGKSLVDAILEGCSVRLRPIIMTNLATAISMLPLALGLGEGSEMRSGMAVVSIGALITSTTFTLYIIPIVFNIVESITERSTVKKAQAQIDPTLAEAEA